MICPGCRADNHPRRRYCGKCGIEVTAACQACGFGNERGDRFCGGCGGALRADARGIPAALAISHPAPSGATQPVDELAGLFVKPHAVDDKPQLPTTGVGQDDLDRLFGSRS